MGTTAAQPDISIPQDAIMIALHENCPEALEIELHLLMNMDLNWEPHINLAQPGIPTAQTSALPLKKEILIDQQENMKGAKNNNSEAPSALSSEVIGKEATENIEGILKNQTSTALLLKLIADPFLCQKAKRVPKLDKMIPEFCEAFNIVDSCLGTTIVSAQPDIPIPQLKKEELVEAKNKSALLGSLEGEDIRKTALQEDLKSELRLLMSMDLNWEPEFAVIRTPTGNKPSDFALSQIAPAHPAIHNSLVNEKKNPDPRYGEYPYARFFDLPGVTDEEYEKKVAISYKFHLLQKNLKCKLSTVNRRPFEGRENWKREDPIKVKVQGESEYHVKAAETYIKRLFRLQ